MNKAITDGLQLMPPAFSGGLSVWSSGDGTPGSASYQGAANAALVPADQDFGGCLELVKTTDTQRLRYMGETPVLPGVYLMVTVRIKAVSGPLPTVRIAGRPGTAGGLPVAGLVETGPAATLASYGTVVTLRAIVGSGARGGVDMVWGTPTQYGHFGIDLTGPNGGTVRIDDIQIEDATAVFQRDMMDWVDVRDYGARGDGTTDDMAAFEAADAAAAGRSVLVPAGSYRLADHVTFENPVRFQGTVTMAADKRLSLTRNFDLPSYAAAFGSEVEGFRRAFQALLNFSDHDTLDLRGRQIEVAAPIDMQAAVANKTTFSGRRLIRNGKFVVVPGAAWDPVVVTSAASYAVASPLTLSGVVNVANIRPGARVGGVGVGREVYVKSVNVAAGTLTLSAGLYAAPANQVYTFSRAQYVLDFSGFESLDRIEVADVEFQCDGGASGVLLAPEGQIMQFRDCVFNKPRERGITSHGQGCQGIIVDRCQFLSNEQPLAAQDRVTIALNVNGNDAKIRNNRAVRFAHFAVLAGAGTILVGNHFFQGDTQSLGLRQAGLVLTQSNVKTSISGNYIDNSSIEWTNEHDAQPGQSSEPSFGGLSITGNTFTVADVAPWFRWLVIRPYGPDHFIHGLNVSGNVFKALDATIDRVEAVDASLAALDMTRTRNITFAGNTFTGVAQFTANPVMLQHDQVTPANVWSVSFAAVLPFGGRARNVQGVVIETRPSGPANENRTENPYVTVEQGTTGQEVRLNWINIAKGRAQVTARMDNFS